MFSGSLRVNLDPFGTVTDDRLWQVIEQCHLKDFVSASLEGLNHECGENGQNLRLVRVQNLSRPPLSRPPSPSSLSPSLSPLYFHLSYLSLPPSLPVFLPLTPLFPFLDRTSRRYNGVGNLV